jgi:hypothetical protein
MMLPGGWSSLLEPLTCKYSPLLILVVSPLTFVLVSRESDSTSQRKTGRNSERGFDVKCQGVDFALASFKCLSPLEIHNVLTS